MFSSKGQLLDVVYGLEESVKEDTLGTGGGFLVQASVRSLHRWLTSEARSGLDLYIYSATSVSE